MIADKTSTPILVIIFYLFNYWNAFGFFFFLDEPAMKIVMQGVVQDSVYNHW